MRQATLVTIVLLSCATLPLAVNDAHAQGPVASPVERFSFLVGDWNCTGQVFAHGKTLAHATRARVHGESAAGGHWILFRYDEEQTAANPRPFHIDQYFGYDPATQRFLSVAVDVGGYFSESSAGWQGDSITFDEVIDGKLVGHDTFTRLGQDEMSHAGMDVNKDGKGTQTDEETCHRMQKT